MNTTVLFRQRGDKRGPAAVTAMLVMVVLPFLATGGLVSPSDREYFKQELSEGRLKILDVELTRAEISQLERAARHVCNMIVPRQVA